MEGLKFAPGRHQRTRIKYNYVRAAVYFIRLEFPAVCGNVVCMDFVTVYTALNPAQAHLIGSRLEASDFLVNIRNENAALGMDGYCMAVGGIQVQVPDDQAEDARALIKSCESSQNE